MSNRSLFPEGVEIHQKQMVYESESRQSDAKNIVKHTSRCGVIDGLEVTVNGGDNTKIDVAAGSAYTPDGRKMTLASAQTGKSITNTLGTVNYVCMVYDEVQSDPEAHRVDASTKMTVASASPRVVVLTESAYNALPLVTTSGMTLSSNAKDRIVILAKVTGTGVGLVSGDIEMPDEHITALNATQPSNISGVTIIRVGSDTPVGDGTLTYTSGTTSITWAAYGESAGASVPLNSSQTYTVFSSGGSSILIDVGVTLLPVANATDTITISDIYGGPLFRFSAVDATHRSKIGSGVVSDNNPHGMTLDDLAPGAAGSLEVHQDVMHANGIGKGSSASILDVTINTIPTTHTLSVAQLTGADSIYINGRRITSIANSLSPASPVDANPATYQLSITQDGELNFTPFVQMAGTYFADKIQVLDVVGVPSGTYQLRYLDTGVIAFGQGGSFGPRVAYTPSVDSLVRAYYTDNKSYIDLWVKGAPHATTTTETLTITQLDSGENFVFATVPWSGSANGDLGYGFGTANAPNGVFYKRVRGTLDVDNVRSDSGITDSVGYANLMLSDGLVYETRLYGGHTDNQITFATAQSIQHVVLTGTPSALFTYYSGGMAIVGGRKFSVPAQTISMEDDATNRIYIDSTGTVRTSVSSWAAISAENESAPYVRLYEVPIAAGVVGTTVDLRTFTGYKRNSELGVVGLNANKEATITPVQSGNRTALRAYGYGSGSGVNGYTHASAPDGTAAVNGIGQGANTKGVWGIGTGTEPGIRGQGSEIGAVFTASALGAGTGMATTGTWKGANFSATEDGSYAAYAVTQGNSSFGLYVDNNIAGTAPTGIKVSSLINGSVGVDITTSGVTAEGLKITSSTGTALNIVSGSALIQSGNSLQFAGGGNVTYNPVRTAHIHINAVDFATTTSGLTFSSFAIPYWGSDNFGTRQLAARVSLPVGATITGAQFLIENTTAGTIGPPGIQLILVKASYTASPTSALPYAGIGSTAVLHNVTSILSTGAPIWSSASVTPFSLSDDDFLLVKVYIEYASGTDHIKFYGVRLTYTYDTNYGVHV